MDNKNSNHAFENGIIDILKNMTSDWERAFENPITCETLLISELGFKSIQVIELFIAIESFFNISNIPYESFFMRDSGPLEDFSVSELAEFLFENVTSLKH